MKSALILAAFTAAASAGMYSKGNNGGSDYERSRGNKRTPGNRRRLPEVTRYVRGINTDPVTRIFITTTTITPAICLPRPTITITDCRPGWQTRYPRPPKAYPKRRYQTKQRPVPGPEPIPTETPVPGPEPICATPTQDADGVEVCCDVVEGQELPAVCEPAEPVCATPTQDADGAEVCCDVVEGQELPAICTPAEPVCENSPVANVDTATGCCDAVDGVIPVGCCLGNSVENLPEHCCAETVTNRSGYCDTVFPPAPPVAVTAASVSAVPSAAAPRPAATPRPAAAARAPGAKLDELDFDF